MKLRAKILLLSLLPVNIVSLIALSFSFFFLAPYPDARKALVLPLTIIVCFALAASVAVIIIMSGKMTQSIKKVATCLNQLAAGNLDATVDHKLQRMKDETGALSRSAVSLKESMTALVINLSTSASTLTKASHDIANMTEDSHNISESLANAMTEIASGSSVEAAAAQSIAVEMLQVSNMVENSTTSTEKFKDFMRTIHDTSVTGQSIIQKLDSSAATTHDEIQVISQQTQATYNASLEIQKAAEFITSIAGQTNLLALNASIEAARAGEQGRGFAVVADQIKTLAQQSNESARQIDKVIRNLLSESEKSVECMEHVQQIIQNQNEDINATNTLFENLNSDIVEAQDEVAGIADSLRHLSVTRDKVSSEIDNLSATSEENAASIQEITASSQELSATAETLSSQTKELKELAEQLQLQLSGFQCEVLAMKLAAEQQASFDMDMDMGMDMDDDDDDDDDMED